MYISSGLVNRDHGKQFCRNFGISVPSFFFSKTKQCSLMVVPDSTSEERKTKGEDASRESLKPWGLLASRKTPAPPILGQWKPVYHSLEPADDRHSPSRFPSSHAAPANRAPPPLPAVSSSESKTTTRRNRRRASGVVSPSGGSNFQFHGPSCVSPQKSRQATVRLFTSTPSHVFRLPQ